MFSRVPVYTWWRLLVTFIVLCAGGPSIAWHLSVYDGPGGDRGSGEDMPGHREALARQLRSHGSDSSIRIAASSSTAQGLPASSQGKGCSNGTCSCAAMSSSVNRCSQLSDRYKHIWLYWRFKGMCMCHGFNNCALLFGLIVNVLFLFFRAAGRSFCRPTSPRPLLQSLGSNMSLTRGWWRPSVSILVRFDRYCQC